MIRVLNRVFPLLFALNRTDVRLYPQILLNQLVLILHIIQGNF
ncbi:Uncharacterised protein [Vibrio cholerae]|nr:Uncharacterised protein [Vibrio cholerae]